MQTNEHTIQPNGKKIISLQALRGIAFLGIFTGHCGATLLAAWGVSIFVILSGFVMFYTYNEREIPQDVRGAFSFSVKKIKKSYPLHIIMMLFALPYLVEVLINYHSPECCGKAFLEIVSNILLIQAWVPSSDFYFSLNGVAWYLSLCLFLYFAFPFLMRYMRRLRKSSEAIIMILIIFLCEVLFGYLSSIVPLNLGEADFSKWFTYIFPLYRFGDFAIGCCLGYLYLHSSHKLNIIIYSLLEALVLVVVEVSSIFYRMELGPFGTEYLRYTAVFTLSSAAVVYLFAVNKGLITMVFTNKFLVYLGNISASAFLIHYIIIRYFNTIGYGVYALNVTVWWKVVLTLAVTILITELYSRAEIKIRAKKKMCE